MGRIKKNNFKRLNVLISYDLKKAYKQFCTNKDEIMSERIRKLIEMDLKGIIK